MVVGELETKVDRGFRDGGGDLESTARLFLQLIPRLNRWAESQAADTGVGQDLSFRQLSALTAIEDETTTLGDVARYLRVTPAVVTGLIDRLERRGYVRRLSGSGDRRRVNVSLTEEGQAARTYVETHLIGEVARRLSIFGQSDMRELERVIAMLTRLIGA